MYVRITGLVESVNKHCFHGEHATFTYKRAGISLLRYKVGSP